MMELCSVINTLFLKDAETRRRPALRLCTYAVLPMTEDSGVIEWVPFTTTFRSVLFELYEQEKINIDLSSIRKAFEGCERTEKGAISRDATKLLKAFKDILHRLPPVFHNWFIKKFPDASIWLQARQNFTASTASWSIVGSILGLGDRHGENLLLNTCNGSLVQVDFDCLFEKGLELAVPERVPFRMTQNMVDAFGVTGYLYSIHFVF